MRSILRAMLALVFVAALAAPGTAFARSAHARIERVVSPVGTMQTVRVDLSWPDGATSGSMRLQAGRIDAPGLGHRFTHVDWQCRLTRRGWRRWYCDGLVRASGGAPMRLEIDITERALDAELSRGGTGVRVERRGDAPDLTRVDLAAIPLQWMRELLARAWPEAKLKTGQGDARLRVTTLRGALDISGPLHLRNVSFDTPGGRVAAEGIGADVELGLQLGDTDRVSLDGRIRGGEALFGTTYVTLAGRSAALRLQAEQRGGCCWRIPRFEWNDDPALRASGSVAFGPGGAVRTLDVTAQARNLAATRDTYLSGWLGAAGLADLSLAGAGASEVAMRAGRLERVVGRLDAVDVSDPGGRFAFSRLDGDVAFSRAGPVRSSIGWRAGNLYGVAFGPTRLGLASEEGRIDVLAPVDVPMLGGRLRFPRLSIRPATGGTPAAGEFRLQVEDLDVAELAKALDLPAFTGRLSGSIPAARYARGVLEFDGGLTMDVFAGRVAVSSLSMERPFGVAPTLSADIALDDLDLQILTGVLGFGTITGRLDGRIAGLRLVDWQPTAFDARLQTDRHRGVPQRISQRAVQNISSVGDGSIVTSLQSRLIGLFDDFGYSRIGIACRLADQVCEMGGIAPRGDNAFVIVKGAGIPRLTVIGINRRVDWATLVERLVAAGKGDTRPVVK